jgi:hypothetical protein
MILCPIRPPRRALLAAALLAGVLAGSARPGPTARAALACRSDPLVILSNGVVLDLGAALDADVSRVQEIHYQLHGPHGVWVVRVISTDGAVRYKEHFEFHDDSHADDHASTATPLYRVAVQAKTADGHHTGWATIAGGYADQLGITPDMVGLAAFAFKPTTPQGKPAPPPPHDQGQAGLPDTVTAALAAWASGAAWAASATSAQGPADHDLVAAVSL